VNFAFILRFCFPNEVMLEFSMGTSELHSVSCPLPSNGVRDLGLQLNTLDSDP
jgi:hypothetical protein